MSISGPDTTPVPFSANFSNDQMKTFFSCALSPQGERFAWLFQTMTRTKTTASVWVSDLDGSNMRRVTRELAWNVDAPAYLHWNPDGKRISYWRQNALWTTPVN
jgi:Tol biopolymer transport system component